jgi:hypothetical protein
MTRKLNIDRILVFNDFPELFLAQDNSELDYLCLLTRYDLDEYHYHCVAISKKRLYQYLNGKIDLREIFMNPELHEWWLSTDTSATQFEITFYSNDGLAEAFLPEADCFFTDELQDDLIRHEVVEHKNVIIHLSLSAEDNRHSIPVDDLGDFSKLYQALVENAYKKSILKSDLNDKRSFIIPKNYRLEAFAASPGSFNLHLVSRSNKDLFGNSIIEEGLRRIDDIISYSENEEELIEGLRQIKGHAISNYRKLLEKIIDRNITFKYKWHSPSSPVIHTRTINQNYAIRIKEILDLKDDLIEEIKEFIGFVKQADVERGSWRITNEEDGKDYTGESEGHLLAGITLKTVKYKFVCQEIVEALKVTEKEKTNYRLITFEELQ